MDEWLTHAYCLGRNSINICIKKKSGNGLRQEFKMVVYFLKKVNTIKVYFLSLSCGD